MLQKEEAEERSLRKKPTTTDASVDRQERATRRPRNKPTANRLASVAQQQLPTYT